MSREYIYLASPYTAYREDGGLDEDLMHERYVAVRECFAHLLSAGLVVYSPIAMTHEADKLAGRVKVEFWHQFNKPFLQHMGALFVLKLGGWEVSKGVTEEIRVAKDRNVPITYLTPTAW